MKKALFLILFVFVLLGYFWNKSDLSKSERQNARQPQSNKNVIRKDRTFLFVPYWTVASGTLADEAYDDLIYFGVSPTKNGLNTKETGYLRLEQFTNAANPESQTHLTLRMLDSTINFAILENKPNQKKIIAETISLAKQHNFDGIILNLELSALPFDSLIQQINSFTKDFYTTAKKQNMQFSITVYGDTFYRIRPFEVKTLAQSADMVFIMAYDFHKAKGNPGPNFPLGGKETYGYDYETLLDHFIPTVPPEKLNVIFGLYGYDWEVDTKNIAQKIGKPLSYAEIQQTIVDNCDALQCRIQRDPLSSETMIRYLDEENIRHTVWFEDTESAAKKQSYLKSKGISNFSFWAYSYF